MNCADWQIISLKEVKSTNDTAQEYSETADACYVIKAEKQTAGRGRRGRSWVGLDGNLFFSVALEFDIKKSGQLVIISSLSLLECVKRFAPNADVVLKWPNDVLLNGAKISGILLEKAAKDYIIIGVGVNIVGSPENKDILYPVSSLKEAGIILTSNEFFRAYLEIFTANLNLLNQEKFDFLRQLWLKNAKGTGKRIVVRQNGTEIEGVFNGIDENGNLLLAENGKERVILAGDIFYKDKDNDRI